MSTPNDGGSAFPCESNIIMNGKQATVPAQGMNLRDYFAAAALPQVFAGYRSEGLPLIARVAFDGLAGENEDDRRERLACVAEEAYQVADAMLIARAKTKEAQS